MSLKTEDIKRKLDKRFKEASNQSFYAIVEEVDETMRTCKLKVGGISYEDVLLYSVVKDSLKGFVAIPAVGSKVLVSRVAGGDRLFVAMYSAIDRIKYTVGDVEVVADKEGCGVVVKDTNVNVTKDGCLVAIKDTEINVTGDSCVLTVGSAKINITKSTCNIKVGGSSIEVGGPGIAIGKGGIGLKATLDALIDALMTLTVTTALPGTPTSPPINAAAFAAVKLMIATYLK